MNSTAGANPAVSHHARAVLRSALFQVTVLMLAADFTAPGSAVAATRASVRTVVSQPYTFRLHITGVPSAATTFWAAYGPLAGKFGIVRLRAQGHSMYAATRVLPTTGETVIAYLAGHGVVRTRVGEEPGRPVTTISRSPYGPLRRLRGFTAEWRVVPLP